MTPRERVIAAVDGQPVDRIPIDCSGHRSSGISAIAYDQLRRHLGLPDKPVRVYDPIQQLAILDDDVLDRFGIDTIELGRAFCLDDADWCDWTLPNGRPCQMPAFAMPRRDDAGGRWVLESNTGRVIAELPDGANFFEQTYWPWADDEPDYDRLEEQIPEAMEQSMWCAIPSPSGAHAAKLAGQSAHRQQALALRERTDRAILGLFGGNLLEMGQFLYRNDMFFMLLAGEPDRAHHFLDAITQMHLNNLEQYLADFGDVIDVIVFGDDLGMQSGPQISPNMYREFFKPRHRQMWHRAKELADVRVMLHCCGGVQPLLADLIDAGLDAINPVQITCDGMALDELRRQFDKQLCFWGGGCDTRDILPNGTADQVRQHTLDQLSVFGTDGGFVFQQVHNVMPNVPPQNIVAMFEAVGSWRPA
jgi:uroporphyrinogen decarboxylase